MHISEKSKRQIRDTGGYEVVSNTATMTLQYKGRHIAEAKNVYRHKS